jgi:nucleotide-binding universal stress UspA family protein
MLNWITKRREAMKKTIVCGVDNSPGARAAVRVAASLAEAAGARLVAVHVLDRLIGGYGSAERIASDILYSEVPDASSEARGDVGDVAERLAAIARDENAMLIVLGARSRGRSRSYLRTRCAAELIDLTEIPIVVAPLQRAVAAPRRFRATMPGRTINEQINKDVAARSRLERSPVAAQTGAVPRAG